MNKIFVIGLLIISTLISSCVNKSDREKTGKKKPWPPRTHKYDKKAATIPVNENLKLEVPKYEQIVFSGFMKPLNGHWVPSSTSLQIEGGVLVSEIADFKEIAKFDTVRPVIPVYKDSNKDCIIDWALVMNSGKLLVPNIFSAQKVPDIYIENRIVVEDYGNRFTLISLEKKSDLITTMWNQLAVISRKDGSLLITAACPGTQVIFSGTGKLYQRKSDGWYLDGEIVSRNAALPQPSREPPKNASEFRISADNLFPENVNIETQKGKLLIRGYVSSHGKGGIVKRYNNEVWVYGDLLRSITTGKIFGKARIFEKKKNK